MNKCYLVILGSLIAILDLILFYSGTSYIFLDLNIGFFGVILVIISSLSIWQNDTLFRSHLDRLGGHKYSIPFLLIGSIILSFELLLRYSVNLILEIEMLDDLPVLMLTNTIILIGGGILVVENYFIHRNHMRSSPYEEMDFVESPDVFISYSSKEMQLAETLHNALIEENILSWISSKNIDPGQQYGLQIVRSIDVSPFFVLLVTKNSISSRHVLTELERAFSNGSAIVPVKLDETEIPEGWEYYLSTSQWMNTSGKSKKEWIDDLIHLIQENISQND